ncbi:MAG: hypothetical protein J6B89_03320 [Bacilli bacterium]|nr:hypothetical protein [Bacilli bacterium]
MNKKEEKNISEAKLYLKYKQSIYGSNINIDSLLALSLSDSKFPPAKILSNIIINHDKNFQQFKEIRSTYQQILSNYTKLTKEFGLKTPIELFAFYSYCYTKGILSKNHTFTIATDKVFDVYSILGADVINGAGNCRHVASLFRDSLISNKMDSNLILVSTNKIQYEINKLTETIKILETAKTVCSIEKKDTSELESTISNLKHKLIIKQNDLNSILKYDPSIYKTLRAKQAITMAIYNSQCILLDPLNIEIFQPKNDRIINNKYSNASVIYYGLEFLEEKPVEYIKSQLCLPGISIKQSEKTLGKVMHECEQNTDILEKFYNENCEIYEDMSRKLLQLKK